MQHDQRPEERGGRIPDEENSAASLDQVRDLLFGRQLRDSAQRFERIEERLAQDLNALRGDARQRLEALEQFARRELEGLARRLSEEKSARSVEHEALGRELRETAAALGRRLDEAREESARAARTLHDEILSLSKNLSDELAQRLEEHSGATESALREIRRRMVDRSSLSSLFAELALELGEPSGDGEARA